MFYAIAHIPSPLQGVNPAPIVRLVHPAASGAPAAPGMPSGPALVPAPPVNGAVFEMPAGLPAFLRKIITVPTGDESSEFAAIQSVAQQVAVPFSHKGPDYALVGTKVPFGKPVPSYEFLWYVGQSYIPGTVSIDGSGAITAVNQSLAGGSPKKPASGG
ncbi:hypothetical protein [Acidithiobacillus ferrooxidans]|uniref:Uncharacterized protein n=1 Tax=Acidithiobacillus ferrooxidans TaxID=920 RepID=A0A2W1K610_ACIFR|nr:hypothetical protein [Acidithiobacillus ferrooxidans]MCR1344010.1 hypothetical protein [Acidithiobacillus ferrooxidans]PZD82388.1 hypothetical protein DN052_05055 [Acidithiobacillus ferrooxidans]QLK41338.1 hypothetical protein FE661_03510 [Acidithiobacillus ferrooxidans]QZT53280.1 hypothetical protein K7B00_03510 [Acidithiobacillus ferrooxidans]BDB13378.1 hypothetical protein ANFP_06980 [Acidithiobacillus ferrooxidans]